VSQCECLGERVVSVCGGMFVCVCECIYGVCVVSVCGSVYDSVWESMCQCMSG